MAKLLDRELAERAGARVAARAGQHEPEVSPSGPDDEDGVPDRLSRDVWQIAARALRMPEDQLDPQENLANLGVDSIAITEIMVQISRHFGISVAPTTFFEARHLDDLSTILTERYGTAIEKHYEGHGPQKSPRVEVGKAGTLAAAPESQEPVRTGEGSREESWIRRHRAISARPARAEGVAVRPPDQPNAPAHAQTTTAPGAKETAPQAAPIAILSMEGMFPQSPDLETFEAHLARGDDCIEEIPPERWDWREVFGDPKKGAFTDVKYGGFVPGADRFDAGFFNISPREAELMDPQHRLFMECVWNLIEKGGYAPGSLSGRKIGLFLGINLLDYTDMVNRAGIMDAQQLTGLGHAFCPNRLSFLLDIHGPSEVVDTACSSSLVAIHRAVMSIRHEGCEMAIAGGSNLMLSPMQHIMFSKVGMIAPDGRCKTFSRDANGYARADGVGAVLLKRLDLAERDGDPILGVIRGTAEHHGGGATSLTAPNPRAQARLIVEAHRQAGTDPRSIGLIECHGTGTPLGDPVEIEGLKLAFQELYRDWKLEPPAKASIGLGSVKSNIGHAETAAGVAGLIKVLLAMRTGTLYRALHCEAPNPLLDLSGSQFHLLQAPEPWQRTVIDGHEQPLRAGLSSFGAGGANVHLVIEEYRPADRPLQSLHNGPVVVPVSAKTEAALNEAISRLRTAVLDADLSEVAYTLQTGRDAMRFRAAFIVEGREDLVAQMDAFLAGNSEAAVQGKVAPGRKEKSEAFNPSGRAPIEIARHWAAGGEVDWLALYVDDRPRRIALPGYSFQRKRYWLPETEAPNKASAAPLRPALESPGRYGLQLTGKEIFLADHKVAGVPVLPGVAYLELVLAAAVQEGIANPSIRQVVWMAPLKVEEPIRVTCELTRQVDGSTRAEIFSHAESGERLLHAQMRVASEEASGEASVDLSALRARPARHFDRSAVYSAFDAMGLTYGPGHRVIEDLAVHENADAGDQVLARLELADFLIGSLDDFSLHPSLLDGALQAAIGLALDDKDRAPATAALPFSIETVDILGPCECCMWAHVRAASAPDAALRKMDIDLIADDGSLRIALRGFATRALAASGKQDLLCFAPRWRVPDVDAVLDRQVRRLILLTGRPEVIGALQAELADCEVRAIEDDRGAALDHRCLDLAAQLLETAQEEIGAGPVLIQLALTGGPDITLMTGLSAMFRSISREHPATGGQVLCVAEGMTAGKLSDHLRKAAALPAGACLKADEQGLSMEVWEETSGTETSLPPWRSDGVYLVTGGTGRLGQNLARDILEKAPGAQVILASRTAPDDALADRIAGAPGLHHVSADLSDEDTVAALVRDIAGTHGKLNGVIHAAGVLQDAAVASKSREQLAQVFAPKVAGVVALDKAIGDIPLDFLALYSSISSVTGNVGQADYAAANGFLNGFAESREIRRRNGECHGRTVSICWPLWKDGGMSLDPAQEELMRRTTGLIRLETRTGMDALYAALEGEGSCLLFAAGDASKIRRFVGSTFELPEEKDPAPSTKSSGTQQPVRNLQRRVLASLIGAASDQLKVAEDDLDPDVELTEYGFDSIGFTQFANRLNELYRLELTPTLFFEYPTLEGLAGHLSAEETAAIAAALGISPGTDIGVEEDPTATQPTVTSSELPKPSAYAPQEHRVPEDLSPGEDLIAIVGMSGQFPGAPDVNVFWDLLKDGRSAICEVPPERWDWRDYWGDPLSEPGKGNVKWGGFIQDIEAFDAAFFGVSAPEARMIDPQQRLLLTEAWRVIEDAGYAPSALAGSKTGVFIGTADTGYSRLIAEAGVNVEGYSMTGLAPSLGPNRISYFYDFHGPSVAVETACSSALIAVHRAVEAIRSGQCAAAIAGGINALLLPEAFVGFSKAGMLSPEGLCKPFSAKADGYVRGEGLGLVFLKPLADAERDGDNVLAVIRASAENHGGHAASLTAPNPKAQAELIRTAYTRSGIDPRTLGYIEAHGTGTPLGDPIEIEALTAAFTDLTREAEAAFGPAQEQTCAIGSVKSNIGHLELAAGIAGLIKVLLQIRHGEIARSLHSEELNPYLKLEGSPFHVARAAEPWERARDAAGNLLPRRAGVSSFGFGGTNAHVVLEEYIAPDPSAMPAAAREQAELIVLSARSEAQLKDLTVELRAFLAEAEPKPALEDIACTLQTARSAMEHRLAFSAHSLSELLEQLEAFLAGTIGKGLQTGSVKAGRKAISVLESDGPLREAAAGLAERGRADDLLALWTGGLNIDWKDVRKGRAGKRIPLPGYPFAKTHYWVKRAKDSPRAGSKAEGKEFSFRIDGSESYLRDHLAGGLKVLPGVFSFELLRRVLGDTEFGSEAFELTGHTWTGMVPVEAGPRQIRVALREGEGAGRPYSITVSGGGGTVRHAEGIARRIDMPPAAGIDLESAKAAAGDEVDVAAFYRRFAELALNYGPAQRAITQLWRGTGTALARLELPEVADKGLRLNPSVLDGALQAVFALKAGDTDVEALALPYSVRRACIYGATTDRMWAIVHAGERGASIDLADDDGNLLVRLEDFVARPAPPVLSADAAPAVEITSEERQKRVLSLVTGIAARTLEVDPSSLDVDTELGDFGFDSVSMTAFASKMNSELGLALTPADFFEFATLARLAEHVSGDLSDDRLGIVPKGAEQAVPMPGSAPAPLAAPRVEPRSHTAPEDADPIVIVGQSCCFPMAGDADAFWDNLITGRDCISRIPEERWSWQDLDGDPRQEPTRTNIHWGGFIDRVFEFDPLFFGISPREARLMDPQQRLMLTHAWKAIEDAGHAPESLAGKKVGVFVGTSSSGYREMIGEDSGSEGYVATGAVPSVGPNRISYLLDLHGPSEPVETACSSSLVALHRAVQAIRSGDCDMALAGGVNTIITPEAHINFAKAGMLSADGRCKTFSAAANGYVRGEGAGMLFVRKLSDAERDGDPILAVLRGTAINHGGHANSLTAPNTQAQADLLTAAYANAAIDPCTVGYIEAHGTGTALGDPVEINALKYAFRSLRQPEVRFDGTGCWLGSVKTNIGHLELAAGVAGVIKVLKQFEHRKLAPSLHCEEINPYIDLGGSPFGIVREARDWQPVRDESGSALPLRAGVSSFGFGGVNAHAILEEYRTKKSSSAPTGEREEPVIVVLSARDKIRLTESACNLLSHLEGGRSDDRDLDNLAFTLQVGRSEMAERLAIVASSVAELRSQLQAFLEDRQADGLFTGSIAEKTGISPPLVQHTSPAETARHWVGGSKVDWLALHSAPRRRLRLPTYPFARDVYRAGGDARVPRKDEDGFRTTVRADDFYLKDHLVRGNRILPGAMSLEIVCKAVLSRGDAGDLPLTLTGVTWRRPVEVNSGRAELAVRFSGTVEETRFRLTSPGDNDLEFMRGEIEVSPLEGEPSPLDIASLQSACADEHDPDWLYACYSALGIDYGPSFRAITELRSGSADVLAKLRVPAAANGERFDFLLHPSLLDAAFQAALIAFKDDDTGALALPFGIDRLTVLRPVTGIMWAYLRVMPSGAGSRKLDIVLADEDGNPCIRIDGFTLRLMETAQAGHSAGAMDGSSGRPDTSAAERYFIDLIARETEVDAASVSLDAPLEDYGIDSVLILQLTDVLERDFGTLPKTLFFEYQTLEALIGYFRQNHAARLANVTGAGAKAPAKVLPATAEQRWRGPAASAEPVAIIGLAGRYPGARTLDEFWKNLAEGQDCVTEVPASRWDHSKVFDPAPQVGKTTGKWGGFIDGHDRFDPLFFNIAPREAEFMDPQERLFLQCAWETLEDAGYTRASVARDGDVGVFVGVMWEEYQLYGSELTVSGRPLALSGSAASIANRVSYFFNFHGPSLALDTMCSSSLTAIHLACESLRSGSSSVALAGGVNLTTHPNKYIALSQGRFLSSKGRCESFGEGGDGYVPAEGVGAVLLKPLSRAEADGDRIYGVILGSALNHGGKTNGYTVPNPAAQTAVIEKALANAGVSPEEIGYVEAHGTGTSLGDPIEIAALTRAYGKRQPDGRACAIGSVKSNIGHAESAAGMAGLTKLLLQFRHGTLVPSLHSQRLNPNIAFVETPFRVQRSLAEWKRERAAGQDLPRIAGLSSFGAGGSNAHFIVAEHLADNSPAVTSGPAVFPFSARDPERLEALLRNFRAHLEGLGDEHMPSVAFTLQEGREAFEERLAVVAEGKAELEAKLDAILAGSSGSPGVFRARAGTSGAGRNASSGDLLAVAASWVGGALTDWQSLRHGPKPEPVSLPTYPFAEDYCWLPEIAGGEPRKSPAPTAQAALPLLFTPHWQERGGGASQIPTGDRLHVLCGVASVYPSLALDLKKSGAEVMVLKAPSGPVDERFGFNALRLFALLKDLAQQHREKQVQVVVPFEGENRLLEGLSGLLRCAALEFRELTCQLVAVDAAVGGLAIRLAKDIADAGSQREIRYLQGRRFVRSWRELDLAGGGGSHHWKENGVYLITGGAGGIGLSVAEAIAASGCGPQLWLTGRSSLKPDLERRLKKLEALGAIVRYRRVDVTEAAAVSGLLTEIDEAGQGLTGIFHGAGLTRDGLLVRKSEKTFREVLEPKVTGLRILDEVVGGRPLDFFALFASASGALGNPGQTDYAAANAFLDSFAAWRNLEAAKGARKGKTIAIDWPYWRDGGMQMDERTIASIKSATGVVPLETDAALAALNAILASAGEDQVLVLDGNHDRLRGLMNPDYEPERTSMAGASAEVATAKRSEPVAHSAERENVVAAIRSAFSKCLGIPRDRLGLEETIDRFGVDSVSALEIVEALEAEFGQLSQTILFEFQTIGRLADELCRRDGTVQVAAADAFKPANAAPAPVAGSDRAPTSAAGDIAIVAVAGRYPDADTIEAFADLLREGRDCVTEIPADRLDLLPRFSERKGEPGASYCKWGAFLSEIDAFDAGFFGYSPRAADLADPQERLFLETAWQLFERAGHTRDYLAEHYGKRVGVFVGSMYNQYPALAPDPETGALLALSSYSAIANRTSFFFDLQGPSVAVDSMCSSGLQAVHQACQSLKAGECRLAVAGGVNLSIHPGKYEGLSRAGLVASSPLSRAFSGGDGYLPAEGVGAVLLKPLEDAIEDGDRIISVIKGSFANHAGHSAGYAVPNVDAQVQLLEDSFRSAGIDPATIGYIEAAATGSKVGDAVEVRALASVFSSRGKDAKAIPVGSVKSNLGHAEAASGLAQLTKVLLQFEREELFPSFMAGGVRNAFAGTPFAPQLKLEPWAAPVADGTTRARRAAISSFGAGGSNVHLILEEAPRRMRLLQEEDDGKEMLFPVSARTGAQLAQVKKDLVAWLRSAGKVSPRALSRTLRFGRETFDFSQSFVAASVEDLVRRLEDPSFREDAQALSLSLPEDIDRKGPMLVLPGYPFLRERHWLNAQSGGQVRTDVAAAKNPAFTRSTAMDLIRKTLASELGCRADEINPDAEFAGLGVDSMARMRLAYAAEEFCGQALAPRDWQNHATPRQLAAYMENCAGNVQTGGAAAPADTGAGSVPYRAPLSEAQKGLWVFQSLYPQSAVYNVPLAFRCRSLDTTALETALDWLVRANPILGTRVVLEDDEPRLSARADPACLHSMTLPKELEPEAYLRQRAVRPFDPGREVFRAELVSGGNLDHDEAVVLLIAHHMVTDGVSSEVITRDFWQAYEHFASSGQLPAENSSNSAGYSEFVAWETAFMRSAEGGEQQRYWLDKLSAPLPDPRLPVSGGASGKGAGSEHSMELRLPRDLGTALANTARAHGTSAAALYLTAFATLLYRYSGDRDIVIGVPTLRRPSRRFAETVGYCANMIALRLAVDPDCAASALLERVHAELRDGLARADYPFAAIARDLGGTTTGETPYKVTFAYQSFGRNLGLEESFASGKVRLLPGIRQQGDTKLGIEIRDEPEGPLVLASCDGAVLDSAATARMLQHYRLLLEAFAARGGEEVRALAMLTRAEEDRALHHWSRTGRPEVSGKPVHERVFTQARQSPSAVAVSSETGRLTYRQLAARSTRIAHALKSRGIGRGDRVAAVLGREPDAVAALLAVIGIGAVWVPLDPEYPDERLAGILQDAGAAAVLTGNSHVKRLKDLESVVAHVLNLDRQGSGLRDRFIRFPDVELHADDPAYMIYTSGSTGAPKGVVVSQGALSGHCEVVAREYGLTAKDVVLQFASPSVDTALEQILPGLISGARLELRPKDLQSPEAFRAFLRDRKITVADLPPVYLHELLRAWQGREAETAALGLRLMIVGGEALMREVVELWSRSGLADRRLVNAYGPTEATITALVHTVKAAAGDYSVPIGRPLPGTEIYILDPDGNLVPDGVTGELHIGGGRLASGYHGRAGLTEAKFRHRRIGGRRIRLYSTGDLACFRPNSGGLVEFHGRIDDQVKLRGHRIELGEVEAAIAACGVAEVAVLLQRNKVGDPLLTAYLGEEAKTFGEAAFRKRLAGILPAHMVPSAFVCLGRLPKTPGGKIDRVSLSLRSEEKARESRNIQAPRDPLEERLRDIWINILGISNADEPLGIDEDFSSVGGHSLLTVRLLSRMEEAFGTSLSVHELATAGTISAQARLLRAKGVRDVPAGRKVEEGEPAAPPLAVSLRQPEQEQAAAGEAPLFLIHPVGGSLSCYGQMVEALTLQAPVYGIRSEGLEPGEETPDESLEALAARYCGQILKVQASGPYRLCGWSLGGVIAYEIARHLKDAGESVSFVGLIDSYLPDEVAALEAAGEDAGATMEARCRRAFVRDLFGVDAEFADDRDLFDIVRGFPQAEAILPGVREEEFSRLYGVFSANYRRFLAYRPNRCELPLTLVRASGGAETNRPEAWATLGGKSLKQLHVDADHFSVLRMPALAEWLPALCRIVSGNAH